MIRILCLHLAENQASYRYRVEQFLPYWKEYGIDMQPPASPVKAILKNSRLRSVAESTITSGCNANHCPPFSPRSLHENPAHLRLRRRTLCCRKLSQWQAKTDPAGIKTDHPSPKHCPEILVTGLCRKRCPGGVCSQVQSRTHLRRPDRLPKTSGATVTKDDR